MFVFPPPKIFRFRHLGPSLKKRPRALWANNSRQPPPWPPPPKTWLIVIALHHTHLFGEHIEAFDILRILYITLDLNQDRTLLNCLISCLFLVSTRDRTAKGPGCALEGGRSTGYCTAKITTWVMHELLLRPRVALTFTCQGWYVLHIYEHHGVGWRHCLLCSTTENMHSTMSFLAHIVSLAERWPWLIFYSLLHERTLNYERACFIGTGTESHMHQHFFRAC